MTEQPPYQDPGHPVCLYELTAEAPESQFTDPHGRSPRAIIVDPDGEEFAFTSVEDARSFCDIHGMRPVSDAEMAPFRAAAEAKKRKNRSTARRTEPPTSPT